MASCSIDGCTNVVNSRGLCRNHYMQLRRREIGGEIQPRVCDQCGRTFTPKRRYVEDEKYRRGRFCSRKCKQDFHNAKMYERDPERMRWYLIRRDYGIGQTEFEALLVWQGSRCAICFADEPRGRGTWHIDHDHGNGEIRGLLCHNCNVLLGHAKDDPARLRAAAAYLERA